MMLSSGQQRLKLQHQRGNMDCPDATVTNTSPGDGEDGALEWKEFFGSSVSLAPDLLSIYDDVIRTNVDQSAPGDVGLIHQPSKSNAAAAAAAAGSPPPPPSVDPPRPSQCDDGIDFCCSASTSSSSSSSRVDVCVSESSGFDDENFQLEAVEENAAEERDEPTNDDDDFGLNTMTDQPSTDLASSSSPLDCPAHRSPLVAAAPSSHPQQRPARCPAFDADDRKRPLSVSSTSSSMSSNSSLPRHQHKKIATVSMTTAGTLPTSGDVLFALSAADDMTTSPAAASGSLATVDEYVATGSCAGFVSTPADLAEKVDASAGERFNVTNDVTAGDVTEPHESDEESDVTHSNSNSLEHHRHLCADHVIMSRLQYIDRVVMEMVETERSYVSDLNEIIQGYLHYIMKSPDLSLTDDDILALFGNIESIFMFNRRLLSSLEQCCADSVRVADCFVRHNDGFVVYSDYCTNYPRSVETLTKCMKNAEVAAALKRQQTALQHGLPLGSYLLKPVQRILKYHIMLQNILNNYDVLEPGHKTIQQALDCMMGVARSINEMKRQHENAVRIQEIQSRLYGWDGADLTTLGDLIIEDKFRMCGAKAYRHIFLFKKAVLIAKRKADGVLLVKAFIMCSNLMLIESIPKEPLGFHLIPFDSPRMQYTVQANTLERKRVWCQQIKTQILENYDAIIPDKAKEIVMMLGKGRSEDGVRSRFEVDEPVRKQHEAPEYLEKRRGRRRSTSFIPELKLRARNGLRRSDAISVTSETSRVLVSDGSLLEEDEQSEMTKNYNKNAADHRPSISVVPNSSAPLAVSATSLPATSAPSSPEPTVNPVRILQDDTEIRDKQEGSTSAAAAEDVEGDADPDDPWLPAPKDKSLPRKNCIPTVRISSETKTTSSVMHAKDCFNVIHTKQIVCNCLLKSHSEASFSTPCTAERSCSNKHSTPVDENPADSSSPDPSLTKPRRSSWKNVVESEMNASRLSLVRRGSLDGLVHAFKGIRGQRVSDAGQERSAPAADASPCWSPVSSSTSTISDAGSEPQNSTTFEIAGDDPLIASENNWLRFPRFIARAYSSRRKYNRGDRTGGRGSRHGGSSAVDVVRRGLTHLMRSGEDAVHSNAIVGERIALGCPEEVAGSSFTLAKSRIRRQSDKLNNVLTHADDRTVSFDIAPRCSEDLKSTKFGSVRSGNSVDSSCPYGDEASGLIDAMTEGSDDGPSESYYESKLFDALEAHSDEPETDSSDNGSYSDMSCTDLPALTTPVTTSPVTPQPPANDVIPPVPVQVSSVSSEDKRSQSEPRDCLVDVKGSNVREILRSLEVGNGSARNVCQSACSKPRLQHELAACAAISRLRRRSGSLDRHPVAIDTKKLVLDNRDLSF